MKYENDQIGKVIFVAPTKPLVNQQIAACHSVTGLSELDTAYLEGGVCPEKRQILWKTKRVFFSTPQTVVNDISGLICDPRQIVCIVLDEAHRANGDCYAYNVLLKQINSASDHFRVIALSATPGKDPKSIQQVICMLFFFYSLLFYIILIGPEGYKQFKDIKYRNEM